MPFRVMALGNQKESVLQSRYRLLTFCDQDRILGKQKKTALLNISALLLVTCEF